MKTIPDRICTACYYNSANDFFDPAIGMDNKPVDQCHWDKPEYPHARACDKFESADKDPEAIE